MFIKLEATSLTEVDDANERRMREFISKAERLNELDFRTLQKKRSEERPNRNARVHKLVKAY